MVQSVLPSFNKVKKALSPFTKGRVIPSFSSSSSTESTKKSTTIDKVEVEVEQVQPKVVLKKLTLKEKKKLFDELLYEATYYQSIKFISTVCETIDEYLGKLNVQVMKLSFDLGIARKHRLSRVLYCHFVSKEEIELSQQIDQLKREIELYREQKVVFEDLRKSRTKCNEFVMQQRQQRMALAQQ